jgi:hypothetical protein
LLVASSWEAACGGIVQAVVCVVLSGVVVYLSSFYRGGIAGLRGQFPILLITGAVAGATLVLEHKGVRDAMPIANAIMFFVVFLLYRLHQIKP